MATPSDPGAEVVPAGNRRVRILLGLAIALLLALLIGLLIVFVKIMTPIGLPQAPTGTQEQQAGFQWVRSMYGYGPSASEQLLSPTAVAIGPNGDIYATDPIRSRVMVFSSSGTFKRLVQTPGRSGPGQFTRPEAVAVDEQGNLFIADSQLRKVIEFNPSGRFLREFQAMEQARGVAAAGGKLYVLDIGTVIVYDATTGKFLRHFGSRGHGPGQIDAYIGIASDGKTVYIADSYNRRIDAFDATTGKFLWAQPGGPAGASLNISSAEISATGGLQLPQDLTLDGNGHLVLVDAFNFDMAIADRKTGKIVGHYGSDPGSIDGQMYYPTGIAYDPARDWFAVADTGNNRIEIFRLPGTGGDLGAGARRWLSSPYKYLCFPAAVLLLTIIAATLIGRRMRRNEDGEDDTEAGESASISAASDA